MQTLLTMYIIIPLMCMVTAGSETYSRHRCRAPMKDDKLHYCTVTAGTEIGRRLSCSTLGRVSAFSNGTGWWIHVACGLIKMSWQWFSVHMMLWRIGLSDIMHRHTVHYVTPVANTLTGDLLTSERQTYFLLWSFCSTLLLHALKWWNSPNQTEWNQMGLIKLSVWAKFICFSHWLTQKEKVVHKQNKNISSQPIIIVKLGFRSCNSWLCTVHHWTH